MKKEFGKLKEFDGLSVSLYRSVDLEDIFDLLVFEYNYEKKNHHLYLRYPNTDHFVELYGGDCPSSSGGKKYTSAVNVWTEFERNIKVQSYESNLLLSFGKYDGSFHFMTLIGRFTEKGNEFLHRGSINPMTFNVDELNEALSNVYLKIPEDIRMIEYILCMGRNYFIVDCPAYNRSSNKQRFRVVRINGNDNPVVEEYKIIKNVVFRDGGTTIMTVVGEDGVEHEFFSPTPIDQDKFPTWDKYVLQKVLIEEKEEIVKILGLVLEPEEPEIKED